MNYNLIKRFFDILFSLLTIIILIPLFLPLIILLKFSGEGEVFYMQERIGYKMKKFKIFKFATMLKDSEKLGTGTITIKNDFRVTRVGKILRKTKINELPQIFNILLGHISIVGPRPLLVESFNSYSRNIRDKIYDSKPGLTGIGSIIFRDEESIISSNNKYDPHIFYKKYISPYKGELELWYHSKKSFLIDLLLILITVWVIIFPKSKIYNSVFKLPKSKIKF
tara:strand:+ start:2482 stop:3153 length:672 start_codon:yes stop_codon:yes gene_type:complete